MDNEIMIAVAPVPGEKQAEKYPGRINVAEDLIRCEAAGASIGHLHARDENLLQTVDSGLFARQVAEVRKACPMVIEGSTGGAPEHTLEQRCCTFSVPGVELGSLNLGSVNMYEGVYQNRYEDIRFYARKLRQHGIVPTMAAFDLSHLDNFRRLVDQRELAPPYLFAFVFDVPSALPYSDRYLRWFVELLPAGAHWFCLRHHQKGAADLRLAMELGGHIRVGYEDSPLLSDGRRAADNVALVEDAVQQAEKAGRKVVKAERAREILGLPSCP